MAFEGCPQPPIVPGWLSIFHIVVKGDPSVMFNAAVRALQGTVGDDSMYFVRHSMGFTPGWSVSFTTTDGTVHTLNIYRGATPGSHIVEIHRISSVPNMSLYYSVWLRVCAAVDDVEAYKRCIERSKNRCQAHSTQDVP